MAGKPSVYIECDKNGELHLYALIENLYDEKFKYKVCVTPGIIPIIGPNGAGKSTFIKNIKRSLSENEDVILIHYDGLKDNGHNALSSIAYFGSKRGNYGSELANRICGSEGQCRVPDIGDFVELIGKTIKDSRNTKKIPVILIDSMETGLSINLFEILNEIFEDAAYTNPKAFIFIATNEYEFAKERPCIYARTGHKKTFKSYISYYNYILKCAKELNED